MLEKYKEQNKAIYRYLWDGASGTGGLFASERNDTYCLSCSCGGCADSDFSRFKTSIFQSFSGV